MPQPREKGREFRASLKRESVQNKELMMLKISLKSRESAHKSLCLNSPQPGSSHKISNSPSNSPAVSRKRKKSDSRKSKLIGDIAHLEEYRAFDRNEDLKPEIQNIEGDVVTANITKNQFEDIVRSVQSQDVSFDTYNKETEEIQLVDKNPDL